MGHPLDEFARAVESVKRKASGAGPAFWFGATIAGAMLGTFLITRQVYIEPGEGDSFGARFERRLAPGAPAGSPPAAGPSSLDYLLQDPVDTHLAAERPLEDPEPRRDDLPRPPERVPEVARPPRENQQLPKPILRPLQAIAAASSSGQQYAAPAADQKEDRGERGGGELGENAPAVDRAAAPEKEREFRAIMVKMKEHLLKNQIAITPVQEYKLEKTVASLLESGISTSTIMLSENIHTWIDGVGPHSTAPDKLPPCTPGTIGCGQKGTLGD